MANTQMAADQVQLANWQKKKPEISGDQKKIVEALKEIGPAIGEEVAQHLEVPYHTISGRFGELQDQGQIQVKGKKQNSRGYLCKIWKVKQ